MTRPAAQAVHRIAWRGGTEWPGSLTCAHADDDFASIEAAVEEGPRVVPDLRQDRCLCCCRLTAVPRLTIPAGAVLRAEAAGHGPGRCSGSTWSAR